MFLDAIHGEGVHNEKNVREGTKRRIMLVFSHRLPRDAIFRSSSEPWILGKRSFESGICEMERYIAHVL